MEIISKAVVPPAVSRSTFVNYAGVYYKEISVHVPEGSEIAYQKNQYWREFWLHPVVDDVHYTIDPDAMTVAVARCEDDITEAVVVPSFAFAGEDVPVTSIDAMAFYHCSPLKSVTLPEGLESIDDLAFKGCMALESVICFAAVPPMMNEIGNGLPFHKNTYETGTLHVVASAVDSYRTASGWKNFLHIAGDAEEMVSISAPDASDSPIAAYVDGVVTTSIPATITVYAQSGARVMRAADATQLSLEALPGGIYIINVKQGGQCQALKVVK